MHKIKRSKPHWLTYKKLKVAHETMRCHILCSGNIRKKQKKQQQPLIQRQYGLKTWITLNIYLGTFNPTDRFRKINFPFGGLWHGPCQGSPLAQPLDTCPTFTPEHTIGRITSNLHCESLLKIDSSCPLQNTTCFSPSIYITISYTAVMAGFNPRISLGDPHLNNCWTLKNIET